MVSDFISILYNTLNKDKALVWVELQLQHSEPSWAEGIQFAI